MVNIDVLSGVVIPDNLTAEELEAIDEFDSHMEMQMSLPMADFSKQSQVLSTHNLKSHECIVHQLLNPKSLCFKNRCVQWTFSTGYSRIMALTVGMKLFIKLRRIYSWRGQIVKSR